MRDGRLQLRPEAVEWRLVEEEIVAMDLRRSLYLTVNRSGASIWPLLAEGATREALVSRLRETFGLSAAAAERDLDGFIAQLQEHDLLERDGA